MLWLQFGLASKPAKASFLTPPERDWLVERQATELAARRKEDAFAGSMWGVFLCTLHTFECCTSDISLPARTWLPCWQAIGLPAWEVCIKILVPAVKLILLT